MSDISQYSIINTKEIEEKILNSKEEQNFSAFNGDYKKAELLQNKIEIYKEILNNFIPLEPKLKESFEAGVERYHVAHESFEDWVKNLTIKK